MCKELEKVLKSEFNAWTSFAKQRVTDRLLSPEGLRRAFAVLRVVKPIIVTSNAAFVTHYNDVLEVLERSDDFSVVPIYAAKMKRTSGEFILGMDNTPRYQAEAAILRNAWRSHDTHTIHTLVRDKCRELIQGVRAGGRLDAIADFSHIVPTHIVQEFFGVPGPDQGTLMRWMRSIFHEIFLNIDNDFTVGARADASASEMLPYLTHLVEERRAQISPLPDNFINRLIEMTDDNGQPLSVDFIVRNIGGVILGAVDTVSHFFAQSLDQLLSRPAALAAAKAVASDERKVYGHVTEALRFHPQTPAIIRRSVRPATIAQGTSRETVIPAGVNVYAATLSAMFDRSKIVEPNDYNPNRPADNYLHFGHGMHTCFGQHVAQLEATVMMAELLKLGSLRRATDSDGKMRYDGPFPSNLTVEFDIS